MKKCIWKWLWRGFVAVGLLTAAILLIHLRFSAGYVQRSILEGLAQKGFQDASLKVTAVSTGRCQIADLSLDADGRLGAGAVVVDYEPGEILGGRIRSLQIIGASWTILSTPEGLDLGPLDRLKGSSGTTGELPFQEIHLRASTLIIQSPQGPMRIPMELSLLNDGNGGLVLEGHLEIQDQWVDLQGTWSPGAGREQPTSFTLEGAGRNWLATLAGKLEQAARVKGQVKCGVTYRGKLPEPLLEWLESSGVGASDLGDLDLQADISGTIPSGADPWQISLEALRGNLEAGIIQWKPHLVDLEKFQGHLLLTGKIGREGASIHMKEGEVGFTSLRGPQGLSVGPGTFRASAPGETPFLTLDFPKGSPFAYRLGLHLAGLQPLAIKANGAASSIANLALEASLVSRAGQPPILVGHVALEGGSLHVISPDLLLADISGRLPFSFHADPEPAGPFRIGQVSLGQDPQGGLGQVKLGNISGQAALHEGLIEFQTNWKLLANPLKAAGSVDLAHGPIQALVKVEMDPLTLEDDQTLAGTFPGLGNLGVRGTFSIQGQVAWGDGRLDPQVQLSLRDVVITDDELDLEVRGLAGTLSTRGPTPPGLAPHQQLTAATIRLGRLDLGPAEATFSLEPERKLFLERLLVRTPTGGRISIQDLEIAPGQEVIAAELSFEALDLQSLLPALSGDRLRGQGLLYGRLPIFFRPGSDENKIRIGEGFAWAEPGTGVISVRDTQTLQQVLEQTNPAFSTDQQLKVVKDRIVEALGDFEYTMLRIDFLKRDGRLLCRAQTRGRGRTGAKQEFDLLTLNITGFEDLLNQALMVKLGTEGAIQGDLERLFK